MRTETTLLCAWLFNNECVRTYIWTFWMGPSPPAEKEKRPKQRHGTASASILSSLELIWCVAKTTLIAPHQTKKDWPKRDPFVHSAGRWFLFAGAGHVELGHRMSYARSKLSAIHVAPQPWDQTQNRSKEREKRRASEIQGHNAKQRNNNIREARPQKWKTDTDAISLICISITIAIIIISSSSSSTKCHIYTQNSIPKMSRNRSACFVYISISVRASNRQIPYGLMVRMSTHSHRVALSFSHRFFLSCAKMSIPLPFARQIYLYIRRQKIYVSGHNSQPRHTKTLIAFWGACLASV